MASPYSTDLLVSFGSTLHVRNFVSTGVLTRLIAEGTSVSVVAPRAAAPFLRREVPGLTEIRALEHVALTPERQAVIHAMRLRAMIALREDPDYAVRMGLNARLGLRHAMATAKWLIQDHGRDGVAAATAVVEALPPSPAAVRMLQELSPGEVVWPTSIADAIDFEVIHAARSLGIPVTFFEGSWDNLTTKGPIWPRPDRVLVWGEYSRNQAVRHHGFSPEVIEVTGPPHFDIYGRDPALFDREAWCAANGLNPDLPIIFFAGTTQSKFVDEPIIVRQLSDWITQGKLPPATVWYRPHPKSGMSGAADLGRLPHVVIDHGVPQPADAPGGSIWSLNPVDAQQRADALSAASVIVSSFSTVVLEGALLGKPAVLVGVSRRRWRPSRRPALFPVLRLSHVQYMMKFPSVLPAHSLPELQKLVSEALAEGPEDAAKTREFALSVAECADGGAVERLVAALRHKRPVATPGRGASPGTGVSGATT